LNSSQRWLLYVGLSLIVCLVATTLWTDFVTGWTAEYWARRAQPSFSLHTYVRGQVIPTRYPGPLAAERIVFLLIVSPPSFISRRMGLDWNAYDLTAAELRGRPLGDMVVSGPTPPGVSALRFLRVALPFWVGVAALVGEGVHYARRAK
jgi:hypothetical protein